MTLRLTTFGSVFLADNGQVLSGAAGQRRTLAILTVLATVGEQGISRDKLLGLLWSDGEPDKSRHALTQSLYHIRRALGTDRLVQSGADLRLVAGVVTSDVDDLQRAVRAGRLEDAVTAYAGPFLDGFYLNGDPEFDFWVSTQRERFARDIGRSLDKLAERAAASADTAEELKWRTRRADHDPLNGPAVSRLMACLIAAGDHSAALQRAMLYRTRLRDELDLPADPAVDRLVERLRVGASAVAGDANPITSSAAAPVPFATSDAAINRVLDAMPSRSAPVRSRLWLGTTLGVAAVAGMAVVARAAASHLASDRAAAEQSTIMVAPFRVESTDPATAYLREGLLDLLSTRIAAADTKRAADPARVLYAWRGARIPSDSAGAVLAAARVARSLGAGEAVIGAVRTTPSGVGVRAQLIDAATGRVRSRADVAGSPDSLIALSDRVMSALLLGAEGERPVSGESVMAVSPLGLRSYLAGRAAYRRGEYHRATSAFEQSLVQDPTFALAALGLAMSADKVNVAQQHDRGLAIAWARQRELPPSERAYLHAFAGPRYPEPSSGAETLAAWEAVVRAEPDRAEAWYELGESFYYDGELLGMHDGPRRAIDAFRHALQLDPQFGPARRMLALEFAGQRDTASLRALLDGSPGLDSADAMTTFVQWRSAIALGDARALRQARRAFERAPNAALRSIAMTSQFDGVSLDDGDRALDILSRRPLTDAEEADVALARHSRALNSGDYAGALAMTSVLGAAQPALHPQFRLRILDALYATTNRDSTAAAVRALGQFTSAPAASAADSAVRSADLCVLGQWRASRGDTSGARAAVTALLAGGVPSFPVEVGANPITCAELLDVSLAVAARGTAALDRLAHLDSLMLSGPAVGDAMRYSNLVVAREYQSLGDAARGLAALKRRSYMRGWPRYRATGLQLQMRLALAQGDTATARGAYQRWMSTRRPVAHPGTSTGALGLFR